MEWSGGEETREEGRKGAKSLKKMKRICTNKSIYTAYGKAVRRSDCLLKGRKVLSANGGSKRDGRLLVTYMYSLEETQTQTSFGEFFRVKYLNRVNRLLD